MWEFLSYKINKTGEKNNRRPTSVAMIMLDFNIGASKLFIEICDEGRDPDIYLGGYCRKKVLHPVPFTEYY